MTKKLISEQKPVKPVPTKPDPSPTPLQQPVKPRPGPTPPDRQQPVKPRPPGLGPRK